MTPEQKRAKLEALLNEEAVIVIVEKRLWICGQLHRNHVYKWATKEWYVDFDIVGEESIKGHIEFNSSEVAEFIGEPNLTRVIKVDLESSRRDY